MSAEPKIPMNAERWRDLRNEAREIAGLFGVPEGWTVQLSWGPDRVNERKMDPFRRVAYVYAGHVARRAHVNVDLHADGTRRVTVHSRSRVFPNVEETLASIVARLQRGEAFAPEDHP